MISLSYEKKGVSIIYNGDALSIDFNKYGVSYNKEFKDFKVCKHKNLRKLFYLIQPLKTSKTSKIKDNVVYKFIADTANRAIYFSYGGKDSVFCVAGGEDDYRNLFSLLESLLV